MREKPILCAEVGFILVILNAPLFGYSFAGGTGEPNDPYQIATAEQLISIGSDSTLLDKHYVLVADIDLDPNLPGGRVFFQSPIAPKIHGSHDGPYGYFEGVFDGHGHVVRNLVIHIDREEAARLFGNMRSPSQIRDLGLEGVNIRRSSTVAGAAFAGGGLVAVNEDGTILASYAIGTIVEETQTPHLTPGSDSSMDDRIGGLVGENGGLVHACYAVVNVRGAGALGGLIGLNRGAVRFSYSVGGLEGTGWIGGLVGRSDAGTVFRCFWDTETSGTAGSDGGEGRTTAQMRSLRTYDPWIYTGAWTLGQGNDYPRLLWQQTPGGLIGDVQPGYDGGGGDPNDPYQIRTAGQFMAIGHRPWDYDKSFSLTDDIDFNDVDCNEVLPIGCRYLAFSGQFDGHSHCLSNLAVVQPDGRGVGVFGVVGAPDVFPSHIEIHYQIGNDRYGCGWGLSQTGQGRASLSNGEIRNLHLCEVDVVGRESVGGLIGLGDTAVTHCAVTGRVTGLSMVGGLVGYVRGGAISGSRVDTQVSGEYSVGGLVGFTSVGKGLHLQDCQASGSVTGLLATGGLIGSSGSDTLTRSAALCVVAGRYFTGGCIGQAGRTTVSLSRALGRVTAEAWVGGFFGRASRTVIHDSYWQGDVTGEYVVGGFGGVCDRQDLARCYAVASVTASNPDITAPCAGGFLGSASGLNGAGKYVDEIPTGISDCFWDTDVCGLARAISDRPANPASVAGMPTARMQTASPFLDAAWDFNDIWTICEGRDYPSLKWEQRRCGD